MNNPTRALVVWAIKDGKPGHENQVMGLVDAFVEKVDVEVYELAPLTFSMVILQLVTRQFSPGKMLPKPDFILAAGHDTHLSLLAARRAYGGKSIVLMKPSLPCHWFDLCLVPAHDDATASEHVLVTRGVLNRMRAAAMKDPTKGLILVGGESRHAVWDSMRVVRQVKEIVEQDSTIQWILTTSRRTPADFIESCRIDADNFTIVPVEETGSGWLQMQLASAAWAWVTEDSVSMLYEGLTAGMAVGVLDLENNKASRVIRGVNQLLESGLVKSFDDWQVRPRLVLPKEPFNEAKRCAEEILKRWPIDA